MGVPGGNKQVHRWLAEPRTVPAKVGRRCDQGLDDAQAATAHGKGPLRPALRQLAWLLVQPAAELGTAEARACGIPAIETFAARLEVDDAGGASPSDPWSSGQLEGQVNRLKLLSRMTKLGMPASQRAC